MDVDHVQTIRSPLGFQSSKRTAILNLIQRNAGLRKCNPSRTEDGNTNQKRGDKSLRNHLKAPKI